MVSACSRNVSGVFRTFSTSGSTSDHVPPSSASCLTSGCSTANTKNVTPHSVSGRVVKISTVSPVSSIVNVTRAPSLLPIQLRCIVSTRSGHASSVSMSSNSRCA